MIKKNSHINHLKREFNENNSFMHFVYVFIKVVHERITLVWSYDNGFFKIKSHTIFKIFTLQVNIGILKILGFFMRLLPKPTRLFEREEMTLN